MQAPRRARRDESGVVAIALALITCFVLIPVSALAVDLGVQRVARSDMQSLADVVALDLARKLDGHTTAAQWSGRTPSLQQIAEESRDRNNTNVGAEPTVVPVLGTLDPDTGDFTPLPDDSPDVPDAVKVSASTSVKFGFVAGEGGTTRSAVAQAESSACFQLGSFAATLDPSASALFGDMLKPLIGTSTLGMVGYAGLANAKLSLLDLMQTSYLDVGTVDDLVNLHDLTVADVYHASAVVLRRQGKTAEADVFDAAAASAVAAVTIHAADLFGITTASDAALESDFNALDILVGTAFLANGNNLLNVANLQTSLSSVGVTSTQLRIIEKPQRACEGEEAQTAQLSLISQAQVSVPNNPVYNSGGSMLKLVDNHIDTGINLTVAGAHGHLTGVKCSPDTFDVDVWTDLATLRVDGRIHLQGNVMVPTSSLPSGLLSAVDLGLLGSQISVGVTFEAVVSADASKPAATLPSHATLTIPPSTYADHVEVGSGSPVLPYVTVTVDPATVDTSVSVAGLSLSGSAALTDSVLVPLVMPTLNLASPVLTSRVDPLLNPLIDKLNLKLDQLTTGLGINVAGADVYGLPTPTCQNPVLRG